MLLSAFIKQSVRALESLYPEDEARSMVLYYCSEAFGLPSYIHVTEPSTEVPPELLAQAQEDMTRLQNAEPLQYVLGYIEFCGRTFDVDERALIPRAETELLCQKAEEAMQGRAASGEGLRIMDLCTGSGCIAWTLALDIPGSQVIATDLSSDALDLALGQFPRVRKPVRKPVFAVADVLDVPGTAALASDGPIDLLTANPPYVMAAEKAEMRPNVLNWEPHMAIFAPDRDPLVFHRAIADIARRVLAPGGFGIVEINSELSATTAAVFEAAGLVNVQTVEDYFGRERFISFSQPDRK